MNTNLRKSQNIIAFILLFVISIGIYLPCDFYLSHGYKNTIEYLFFYNQNNLLESLLTNNYAATAFEILKIVPVLVFIFLGSIWIDFFRARKRKTTQLFLAMALHVFNFLKDNKQFLINLGKPALLCLMSLLGTQIIAYIYFLIQLPLSYDEWWSYANFSGQGFWYSFSRYPLPNNHVLYNVVTSQLVSIPVDIKYSIRLTSVISSIVCSYLFFKICKRYFSTTISLFLLAFTLYSFPVVMYGIQARGYSLVCLFTVLLIYASLHLAESSKHNSKYRFYFVLSLVAGHFAVPTFLYASAPVMILLGISMLVQKRYSDFVKLVKDGVLGIVFTIILYASILLLNDPQNLLNPNGGATKFLLSESGAFTKIVNHFLEIGTYLIGYKEVVILVVVYMLGLRILTKQTYQSSELYLYRLTISFLLSPIIILIIHRVLPFERTWLYLIYPFCLGLGFILKAVVSSIKPDEFLINWRRMRIAAYILFNVACIFFFVRFNRGYHMVTLDFEEEYLGEKHLKPLFGKITTIAHTETGYEFHPAHVINCMSYKYSKQTRIVNRSLDTIKNEDLLVIHGSQLSKYSKGLQAYTFIQKISGDLNVFVKDSLMNLKSPSK